MKVSVMAAIVAAGIMTAGTAHAANAIVTADLNVRSGPGTGYGALGSIPNRAPVTVHGCASSYNWCQVSFGGLSGWASSRYLAMREGTVGGSSDFGTTAAMIGIPLIAGVAIGAALNDRGDRYYRHNSHRHRGDYRRDWRRGNHRHWNRERRGPR